VSFANYDVVIDDVFFWVQMIGPDAQSEDSSFDTQNEFGHPYSERIHSQQQQQRQQSSPVEASDGIGGDSSRQGTQQDTNPRSSPREAPIQQCDDGGGSSARQGRSFISVSHVGHISHIIHQAL
jgi:hypothetical protein